MHAKTNLFGTVNTDSYGESLSWLNLNIFFPLGEITKNRKTCEKSSSSEESEAGEDNDADDSDEESESDHAGKHGQDLHKKTSKKYGKGMTVFS